MRVIDQIRLYKPILGQGKLHDEIPALIEHITVFQRGGSGSIATLKRRVRRSSVLMHHDTVSLLITLGANLSAKGQLYMDDERTFAYKVSNRFTLDYNRLWRRMRSRRGFGSKESGFRGVGELYIVPTNILREFEGASAVISVETKVKEDDMESGVTNDSDLDQLIVRKPALILRGV
ncbi:hypothetical protein ABG067_006292 [Albugo candida]